MKMSVTENGKKREKLGKKKQKRTVGRVVGALRRRRRCATRSTRSASSIRFGRLTEGNKEKK